MLYSRTLLFVLSFLIVAPIILKILTFLKYIYLFDQSFVSSVSLLSLSGTLSAPGLDSDVPSWAAAVFLLSCANLPHAWTNISPLTTADLPFPTTDFPLTLLGSDILPDTYFCERYKMGL